MPACAAEPACRRLVQLPSARYSMMPRRHAAGDADAPGRWRVRRAPWRCRRPPRRRARRAPRSDGSRPCGSPAARRGCTRHMSSTPTASPFMTSRAGEAALLGQGEHRRHDHGAGMDRPALEGVVEILAMRGRAVDERGLVAGRASAHGRWPSNGRCLRDARQRRRARNRSSRAATQRPVTSRRSRWQTGLTSSGKASAVERGGPMTDPLGKRCLARFCFGDAVHGVASLRASDWRVADLADERPDDEDGGGDEEARWRSGSSRKIAWSPPDSSSERR